jgi:hypothetical protein
MAVMLAPSGLRLLHPPSEFQIQAEASGPALAPKLFYASFRLSCLPQPDFATAQSIRNRLAHVDIRQADKTPRFVDTL